jgi:DNA-binding NtrC family response regulator
MQRILDIAQRIAIADANVLITGDNGTGKGLIARHVHRLSKRNEQAFVTVNMGGLAPSVFESEMFGHVKGAFTDAKSERMGRIEMANGGTLFLDEIGNLPVEQQAKLLHVLETGRFEPVGASRSRNANVRLIAATNADLKRQVADGDFRKDLFFRLNTVEIHIPPLHQRPEDIAPLAHGFLQRFTSKYARAGLAFSRPTMDALLAYSWPGNVRELSHVVERAVLLATGEAIAIADLNLQTGDESLQGELPLMTMDAAEESLLRTALKRFDGNVVKSARALGLSRSALYRRLEKFGLDRQ